MFWPYRPRDGYPSVPAWALVLLLCAAILVLLLIGSLLYTDETTQFNQPVP